MAIPGNGGGGKGARSGGASGGGAATATPARFLAPGRGTQDRLATAARIRADRNMFTSLGITNRVTAADWQKDRARLASMTPKQLRAEAKFLADKIPVARLGTRQKYKRGLAQVKEAMAARKIK